LQQDQ